MKAVGRVITELLFTKFQYTRNSNHSLNQLRDPLKTERKKCFLWVYSELSASKFHCQEEYFFQFDGFFFLDRGASWDHCDMFVNILLYIIGLQVHFTSKYTVYGAFYMLDTSCLFWFGLWGFFV